jgi:hypothetical protein
MFNGFDLTAEDLLAGQDPKGLVMCFFKHSDRVHIRSIRVDGLEYRGGRLGTPLIDPETGCTAEEMGETLVRSPITIEPVRPTTCGWGHLNQEVDREVA